MSQRFGDIVRCEDGTKTGLENIIAGREYYDDGTFPTTDDEIEEFKRCNPISDEERMEFKKRLSGIIDKAYKTVFPKKEE